MVRILPLLLLTIIVIHKHNVHSPVSLSVRPSRPFVGGNLLELGWSY